MVDYGKLRKNFEALQKALPQKPAVHTPDYPRTIAEALSKYANQKTVNLFGANVYNYNTHGWPVPLYVDSDNIKVGFINNIFFRRQSSAINRSFRRLTPGRKMKKVNFWTAQLQPWNWIVIPLQRNIFYKDPVDTGVIAIFETNIKFIKARFLGHSYLLSKTVNIEEIFQSYKRKQWVSCIDSIFPLVDLVARRVLKTNSLKKDMQSVCKLFRLMGIGEEETDVLMPHMNAVMLGEQIRQKEITPERGKELREKGYSHNLNLIGIALSSFLHFTNRYYGYFETETDAGDPLNRHAIMHGAEKDFGTKANTVRLLTYLYLILELDPVFGLLFKE
jgi:hypothetical protein